MTTPTIFPSQPNTIFERTLIACELVHGAIRNAGKFLVTGEEGMLHAVLQAERELDRLDTEIDEELPYALANAELPEARRLLVCMKFILDIERLGDLIAAFCARGKAILGNISEDDLVDFTKAISLLDRMIVNAGEALKHGDIERSISVLRADAEIDRIRNLVYMRHLENSSPMNRDSMHILIMMQAIERAGDHIKNLAEEVCHLVSGRSVRHALRDNERSYEQLFIDWLRQKHAAAI